MNSKQFITALLSGYPEVLRPGDKDFLRSIQENIQAINPSGETLRSVYKRLLDTCDRFPTWSMVKQCLDSIQNEQRASGSHKITSEQYSRWRMEACSLDDALPFMREQLVESGEMSLGLLAVVTGKHRELGIHLPPNIHPPRKSPRLLGWTPVASLVSAPMGVPCTVRDRDRAAVPPPIDHDSSSIAALDIASGGTPTDLVFPVNGSCENEGLLNVLCEGPDCEEVVTAAGNSVYRPAGPPANSDLSLDRCGSCGRYFLRSGACSCKDISDYDDSDPWEGL